jgi:hypothetical protein
MECVVVDGQRPLVSLCLCLVLLPVHEKISQCPACYVSLVIYIMKKLGTFMKEKRETMGLSLRDASRLSEVSHAHIRDIEDGRSKESSFPPGGEMCDPVGT